MRFAANTTKLLSRRRVVSCRVVRIFKCVTPGSPFHLLCTPHLTHARVLTLFTSFSGGFSLAWQKYVRSRTTLDSSGWNSTASVDFNWRCCWCYIYTVV